MQLSEDAAYCRSRALNAWVYELTRQCSVSKCFEGCSGGKHVVQTTILLFASDKTLKTQN